MTELVITSLITFGLGIFVGWSLYSFIETEKTFDGKATDKDLEPKILHVASTAGMSKGMAVTILDGEGVFKNGVVFNENTPVKRGRGRPKKLDPLTEQKLSAPRVALRQLPNPKLNKDGSIAKKRGRKPKTYTWQGSEIQSGVTGKALGSKKKG